MILFENYHLFNNLWVYAIRICGDAEFLKNARFSTNHCDHASVKPLEIEDYNFKNS